MDLIKEVRITGNNKVTLYQEGKRKSANIGFIDSGGYYISVFKGKKMDRSMTDDEVIIETVRLFAISDYAANTGSSNPTPGVAYNTQKDPNFYKITQDPWSDEKPPSKRHYGFDPYFLNNGCKLQIGWMDQVVPQRGHIQMMSLLLQVRILQKI